jgi:hypothetical protein
MALGKIIKWPWPKRAPVDPQAGSVPIPGAGTNPPDDFTRRRRLIESFAEDYLSWADRAKLAAAKFVAFALPVLAVVAVGTDIGAFFTPALGAFSSYILAYAIEGGIAALTLMLGMAAQRSNEPAHHWIKFAIAAVVWLVASVASGLVMYTIALNSMPVAHSTFYYAAIGLRTSAVALIDLMSVCILFFRGKSLQRYLQEMAQKSHAIGAANEAELSIGRAQEQARMRELEDKLYIEGKRRQHELVNELQEVSNQALLEGARRNLLRTEDSGTNRRIGRY